MRVQAQIIELQKGMSNLPPKADMCSATRDVCFGPKADIGLKDRSSVFTHHLYK